MFKTRWIGYDRTEVDSCFEDLHLQLERLKEEFESVQKQNNKLSADIEEQHIRMAALRRELIKRDHHMIGHSLPIALFIGPVPTFAALASVADELDVLNLLTIHFRVFREGIYRVDASTSDMMSLTQWLTAHTQIRKVTVDGESIHVLLK